MIRLFAQTLLLLYMPLVIAAGNPVTYEIEGNIYEGYLVMPSADTPLVLLIHDWNGLTEYEMKRAEMLAKEGYSVIAADLFGKGVRPTEDKDKRQHTGELYRDRAKMRALMHGALDAAKTRGADINNAVVMGYCFGGAAALELARSGASLKGFVSFHGGLTTPEDQGYNNTQGKVMVFHGSADTAITMDDFAQLAKELETAGIPHEMTSYGGAPHGFTEFESDRYHRDADVASWNRLLQFLDESYR